MHLVAAVPMNGGSIATQESKPSGVPTVSTAVVVLVVAVVAVTFWFVRGGSGVDPARCVGVTAPLVQAIEAGLTVGGRGSLGDTAAVRSDYFSQVYFIAAEIRGQRMGDTVGIWASNSLGADGNPGLIHAVNGAAKEFSQFPAGSDSAANLTLSDDGARESEACLGL